MSRYWTRFSVIAATLMLPVLTDAEQVRQRPTEATVAIEVALKAGSTAYDAKAQGSCTHAPKAAIYGVVSEMWTVRHREDGRSLQLTLWKPMDGSTQMFNLSVNGPRNTTVSTVRGGQVSGSGTVTFAKADKGGTFTIDAKDKAGAPITGTIKCEAFTAAIAEGGD